MVQEKKANPDIVLRLPEEKKILKAKLKKIAKRNRLNMTELMIYMMEWFLEEIDKGTVFMVKIK